MCRSSLEGGRRCPCTGDRVTLDAHNERRRNARALRSAAISWAGDAGVPRTAVEVLAAASPGVVASWARGAGAPSEVFNATNQRRLGEREISDASWATPQLISLIARSSAAQGSIPEEAQLSGGAVAYSEPTVDGVNQTLRVELDNGIVGYHKAFSRLDQETAGFYGQASALQPIHEVSAWIVARELGPRWRGMVPPTVLRTVDGRLGSFSRELPGTITGSLARIPSEQLDAAAFFDSLIGQQDRNAGNYLVDENTRQLHLIDHGFAFGLPGNIVVANPFVSRRNHEDRGSLAPDELALLDRIVKAPHLGIPSLLEPARGTALVDRARRMRLRGALLDEEEL